MGKNELPFKPSTSDDSRPSRPSGSQGDAMTRRISDGLKKQLSDSNLSKKGVIKKAEVRISENSTIDYYDTRTQSEGTTPTRSGRVSLVTAQQTGRNSSGRPTQRRQTMREQEKAREAERERAKKPPIPKPVLCSRYIVENKLFMTATSILTVWALIGDDLRLICTNKPADPVFNGLTIGCIVIFLIEVILSSVGKEDYFGSFFFTLDFISTVTLLLDLTWISDKITSDDEDLDKMGSSGGFGMGATTRMARVVRVLRLVRILKLYKAYHEAKMAQKRKLDRLNRAEVDGSDDDLFDDSGDKEMKAESMQRESRVGKRLSELTTRRVVCLVLGMMLMLPILRVDESQQYTFSASYGADLVQESFDRYSGSNASDAERLRDAYVYQMLQIMYYHNFYTGHDKDCPIEENMCPATFFNYIFWVGIVAQDDDYDFTEQVTLASLPLAKVNEFNEATQHPENIFNYGDMPPKVVETLGSKWTQDCAYDSGVKGVKVQRRGVSMLSHKVPDKVSYIVNCPEDLRKVERIKFIPQAITRNKASVWHFGFYFDKRSFVMEEAGASLMTTAFVCFVLCVASVFFSNDADTLVLNPVEMMISRVEKIRDNPLLAMKMSDDEFRQEEARKAKERMQGQSQFQKVKEKLLCTSKQAVQEPMETVILEKTIIKIGSLLALGFGEAGANIIEHNMQGVESAMVTAMVEGTRVECIMGCARIRDFSTATEVLRGSVMTFVNQIAEIVHGVVDEFHGAANKNNGDMFLLIWRTSDLDDGYSSKLADMAMLAFTRILGAIHRSTILASYRMHPGLQQRLGKHCRVNLSFSLHYGWAIEGAVGSEFKIDASYLSPNVSIAESLESATYIYSVSILVSETVIALCTPEMAAKCRLIDRVLLTGQIMELYVIDLDYMSLTVEQPPVGHITWNPRQRFRVRQFLEAEKATKWADEVQMVNYFNENPDVATMRFRYTLEFTHVFGMGYQNYIEGEWAVAERFLSLTRKMLGVEDGPSAALLRYMEHPYKFEKPATWKGIRDLGSDNLGL